jgi:protein gp37
LLAPLKRKEPTVYFVNSMGDLFHPSVPDEWIDKVFAIMALCPQHTFQVLTKQSARMREYLSRKSTIGAIAAAAGRLMEDGDNACDTVAYGSWPLPNVWLGVSAEDQRWRPNHEQD